MITVAHTCFALLIAIDNINTVCEIVLLGPNVVPASKSNTLKKQRLERGKLLQCCILDCQIVVI